MATRTVTRQPRTGVPAKFAQFASLQASAKELTSRANLIKAELMAFAEKNGKPDEKGHLVHTLASAVEAGGATFKGFMRQRKVKQTFNEDRAEDLCRGKKIAREEYISTVEYVDQDKIARLYADGKITEAEFDSLIDETVEWAFVPVKA
jgi:hypothetical protein